MNKEKTLETLKSWNLNDPFYKWLELTIDEQESLDFELVNRKYGMSNMKCLKHDGHYWGLTDVEEFFYRSGERYMEDMGDEDWDTSFRFFLASCDYDDILYVFEYVKPIE